MPDRARTRLNVNFADLLQPLTESCTPHNTLNGTSPVDLSSLPRIPFPLNGETTLSLNVETTKPGNLSVGVSMWGEENPDTIPEAIGTVPWGEKSVEGTGAVRVFSLPHFLTPSVDTSLTRFRLAVLLPPQHCQPRRGWRVVLDNERHDCNALVRRRLLSVPSNPN